MENEEMKYICRICGGKHWHPLNAIECCDDIKMEEHRTQNKAKGK